MHEFHPLEHLSIYVLYMPFTQIQTLLEQCLQISSITILNYHIKVPLSLIASKLLNYIRVLAQLFETHSFLMQVFEHSLVHFTSCEQFAGVEFSLLGCIFICVLIGQADAFIYSRICATSNFLLEHVILYPFHYVKTNYYL